MTSRVTLISPAMNRSLREARFDDGCRLDASGAAHAESAAGTLPAADRVWVSPTARCRETASALGLTAMEAPELGGLDVGGGGAGPSTTSAAENRRRSPFG